MNKLRIWSIALRPSTTEVIAALCSVGVLGLLPKSCPKISLPSLFSNFFHEGLLIWLAVLVLVLFLVIRSSARLISLWGAHSLPVLADRFLLLFVFIGSIRFVTHGLAPFPRLVFLYLFAITSAILIGRCIASFLQPKVFPSSRSLFDEVLGEDGLEPLGKFDKDELDRKAFVDHLEDLIAYPRPAPLTFGLNGIWGLGKTTVFDELERRLKKRNFVTVRFDAWSYREPTRLIEGYFSLLNRTFSQWILFPRLKVFLGSLFKSLSSVETKRPFSALLDVLFSKPDAMDIDEARSRVVEVLSCSKRPTVVFVDDLDRLDSSELHAAFRAIRLVSGLPKLTHVLAYDRSQIDRLLFPTDATGSLARDFVSKVVNIELQLPHPSDEVALAFLARALQPFLNTLDEMAQKEFVARFSQGRVNRMFFESLPTPREIRRVAATATWILERVKDYVNAYDLFVLLIIQFRYPRTYHDLQTRRNLFTLLDASQQMALGEDEIKRSRQNYVTHEIKDASLVNLLQALTPPLFEKKVSETDYRRQRRFCHRDITQRYFQLSLPPQTFSEFAMENLADEIRKGSDVRALISGAVKNALNEGRIESFLSQWDILETTLGSDLDEQKVRDLMLGIADIIHLIPAGNSESYLLSPRSLFSYKLMALVSKFKTDDEATAALEEALKASKSIGFCGDVFFYANDPKRGKEVWPDRTPNADKLAVILEEKLQHQYIDQAAPFLPGPYGDLIAGLFRVRNKTLVQSLIMRDLKKDPLLVSELLRPFISRPPFTNMDEAKANLSALVDIKEVAKIIDKIPLDKWTDKDDRYRVQKFLELA